MAILKAFQRTPRTVPSALRGGQHAGRQLRDEVERREWVGWTRAGMTAEVEPSNTCAICKRAILPGSGRYRTEDGDVHEECYQERHGRKPPAEAR